MFTGEKKFNVVLSYKNGGAVNTDLIFATDSKEEAIKFAQEYPDNSGVEIWADITDDGYEVVAYDH